MEIATNPAINIAKLLVAKKKLKPPINVKDLVKEYSDLKIKSIPIAGVDGISLNLKVIGKKTCVIVNADVSEIRQRFTLAHELGHVLIPWHTGNIVEFSDYENITDATEYYLTEQEANDFASELLIPNDWLKERYKDEKNIARLHKLIASECDVSLHAAAIRLARFLEGYYVYAVTNDDIVEYSGKTISTPTSAPIWALKLPEKIYNYSEIHYTIYYKNRNIHWWKFSSALVIDPADQRPWREILNEILSDLYTDPDDIIKAKRSINGIIAASNGSMKGKKNYTVEGLSSIFSLKFKQHDEWSLIENHRLFPAFIHQRACEFIKKADNF